MRVEKSEEKFTSEPKKEKQKEPQPLGKVVFLGILAVCLSVLFWFLLSNVLNISFAKYESFWQIVLFFVYILIAFTFFLGYLSLMIILVRGFWLRLACFFLIGLSCFIFFKINLALIINPLLIVVGLSYFSALIKGEITSRIKFSVDKIIVRAVGILLFTFLISISITYYSNVSTKQGEVKVLDNLANVTAYIIDKFMVWQVKGYLPESTLDEFFENTSVQVEEKSGILGITEKVNNNEVKNMVDKAQKEAIDEAREKFLTSFGIQAEGTETMHNVIRKIIAKKINDLMGNYIKFIPAIAALTLFFVLLIFNYLFKPLIRLFAFIIYKIFLWTKFVRIKKEMIEAERINL